MRKQLLGERRDRNGRAVLPWRLAKGLLTLTLLLPPASPTATAVGDASSVPAAPGGPSLQFPASPSAAPESPLILMTDGPTCGGYQECLPQDRLERIPNLMGGFFARGGDATFPPVNGLATFTSTQLLFVDSFGSAVRFPSVAYSGPNGFSFTPPLNCPVTSLGPLAPFDPFMYFTRYGVVGSTYPLAQNQAFSGAVDAAFRGAQFVSGTATLEVPGVNQRDVPLGAGYSNSFVYQFGVSDKATILLPNPAGGGLAGRNDYFENGSALPRDRAYFYYSGVSDFAALGRDFNINRYTLGGEKTFCDGRASVEVRLPLAGTADPTQSVVGPVSGLDSFVLGNLGVLGKAALVRTDDFILTAGFGVSVPTAPDTRINSLSGAPLLEVNNDTVLLQPVVATAWAPTERLFVQGAAQFDIDAFGNPVYGADGNGGLTRLGRFMDQGYTYLHGGLGYWVYQDYAPEARLSGVALLTELSYIKSMGEGNQVVTDQATLAPLDGGVDDLNVTVGANVLLGDRASISAGVALPVGGPKPYDWVAQVQLNWYFGRWR